MCERDKMKVFKSGFFLFECKEGLKSIINKIIFLLLQSLNKVYGFMEGEKMNLAIKCQL